MEELWLQRSETFKHIIIFVSILYKAVQRFPSARLKQSHYFDMIPMLLKASVKNAAMIGNILNSSNPNGAMITNASSP